MLKEWIEVGVAVIVKWIIEGSGLVLRADGAYLVCGVRARGMQALPATWRRFVISSHQL